MNPQSRSWVGKGCIVAVKVLLILGQLGVLLIFLLRVPKPTLLLSAQCQWGTLRRSQEQRTQPGNATSFLSWLVRLKDTSRANALYDHNSSWVKTNKYTTQVLYCHTGTASMKHIIKKIVFQNVDFKIGTNCSSCQWKLIATIYIYMLLYCLWHQWAWMHLSQLKSQQKPAPKATLHDFQFEQDFAHKWNQLSCHDDCGLVGWKYTWHLAAVGRVGTHKIKARLPSSLLPWIWRQSTHRSKWLPSGLDIKTLQLAIPCKSTCCSKSICANIAWHDLDFR